MAAYNKKKVKQKENPQQRCVKNIQSPKMRGIVRSEDPNQFYQWKPSWNFHLCDNRSWVLDKNSSDLFWDKIFPQLKNWENHTWQYILIDEKSKNHPIKSTDLNQVARKRLDELEIEEESVYSLRLQGQYRLYGFIEYGVFNILWFDTNHGDNATCVCRSHKKNT